jgi:anti-sigma regulatory factor (Ser/Thr protein kinase)
LRAADEYGNKRALMHEGSITIRLPVEVREIERLNGLVRQFGELHEIPSRALYAVNLALDEVVTNTILYGFEDSSGQELSVRVSVAGSELQGELVDEGRHFNPLEVAPPNLDAPLRERELGGLGLHLVRSLMDRLDYRREGSKNVLTLVKRIR